MFDVRPLHPDDIPQSWEYIKTMGDIDVLPPEYNNNYTVIAKNNNSKAVFHCQGFQLENQEDPHKEVKYKILDFASILMEFYPPNGLNIRFDIQFLVNDETKDIFEHLAKLIIKYRNAGRNRISYYLR